VVPAGQAKRLALAAALITLLASGATARAHEPASPRPIAPSAQSPFLGVIGTAPDFSLLDTGGRRVHLADDRDRVVLIAFVYTSCTTACPTLSLRMSLLQRQLLARGIDGRRVRFYSITVDPERDAPEVLSRYAKSFVRDAEAWRFLYESPERLRPVLAAYKEWTRPLPNAELDHPARLYLIDGRGQIREIYSLAFFDETQAFADIAALLQERKALTKR
jgi:protein SCO1/2